MHDVRVRAAYERTPRVPRLLRPPINRNARVPGKSPHFSPFSHDLASISVPVQTRSSGLFAQVPRVDFTPEIPENPEENPFPETKLCPVFHLAIFKLSCEFIPLK